MDSLHRFLAQPHLSVVTGDADVELIRIKDIIEHKAVVEGRVELEELFGQLLAVGAEPTPKTLDLIGHSSPVGSLLQLGDWVLDAASPIVTAFFRELADHDVLPRLGIVAVRLLGCSTAGSESARWTLSRLAEILGLEVYGTSCMLFASHYDATGFRADREYVLVSSAGEPQPTGEPTTRFLDIDALPATTIRGRHRLASRDQVRALLRLVRRNQGAMMPGPLATPICEIAIPSVHAGAYHRAQLVMNGEFIRVYPDGDDRPGVLYPATDRRALEAFVESLPLVR